MNIGRHANDDVVSDGLVTFQYHPDYFTAFEMPKTFVAFFKATSNTTIHVIDVLVKSHNSTCSPYLDYDSNKLIDKDGWNFSITFNCSKEGNAYIYVSLALEGSDDLQFAFTKKLGSERIGLHIGTAVEHNYGINDVVDHGKATLRWHPESHSAFFLSWIMDATFYLTLLDEYTPHKIEDIKTISETDACTPYIQSELPDDGLLYYNVSSKFTLHFNCTARTREIIRITIHLKDFPPITYMMTKILGGSRRYFDVGTEPENYNVVFDGIATPFWLIDDPLNGAVIDGKENRTNFYLTMSSSTQNQSYAAPRLFFSNSKDGVMNPVLSGPSMKGGKAYHGGSEKDNYFSIDYNCKHLGYSNVSVLIDVYPYDPIQYRWKKICSTERTGFHVGTLPGFDNVVSDGMATLPWGLDTHMHYEKESIRETSFYITLDSPQKIQNITVESSLGCNPYIETNIKPGDIIDGYELYFVVIYKCSKLGSSTITVKIDLYGVFMPIAFRWTKKVGGIRYGLGISSNKNGFDVVSNGTPQLAWDPNKHSIEMPEDKSSTQFYFRLDPNDTHEHSQKIESVNLTSSSRNLIVLPAGDLYRGGNITTNEFKLLSARYFCLVNEKQQKHSANVTAMIELEAYETIQFGWTKHCYPYLKGLYVGSAPDKSDIVYDGIPNPDWCFDNNTVILDQKVFIKTFYVYVDSKYNHTQPLEDIFIFQRSVENINLCKPTLSGSLMESKLITSTPQDLSVLFNCSDAGIVHFSLILHIEKDYGSTAFGWRKLVGGPRDGLHINSDYGRGIPVVRNGITEHKWRSEDFKQSSINDSVGYTQFEIFMDKNTQFPYQPHSKICISARPEMSCHYHFMGDIDSGVVTHNPRTINIIYNCFEEEDVFFKITFDISPHDPISFSWHKESSGEDLAFNVMAPENQLVVSRGRVVAKDHVYFDSSYQLDLLAYLSDDYFYHNVNSSINDIVLSISNPLCKINMTGPSNGMITRDHNVTIHMDAKDCKLLQDVNIVVTYDLQPFKSVHLKMVIPATVPENSFPVAMVVSIAGSVVLVAVIVGIVVHLQLKKWKSVPQPQYFNVNEVLNIFVFMLTKSNPFKGPCCTFRLVFKCRCNIG